jgi:hypothetical protein
MESVPAEIEEDKQFSLKMTSLSFVTIAHLDIPAFYIEHEPMLGPAQEGVLFVPFSLRFTLVVHFLNNPPAQHVTSYSGV